MRETLPQFFGFEAVGILIYNFETNYFFVDPDVTRDGNKSDDEDSNMDSLDDEEGSDKEHRAPKAKKEKKDKKDKPVDYFKRNDANLSEAEKIKRIREIHDKKFMNFPTNSGISGQVFRD